MDLSACKTAMGDPVDLSSMTDADLSAHIKSLIRTIPDFPKPPILFRDITTLLQHPTGLTTTVELMQRAIRQAGFTFSKNEPSAQRIDAIVGIESRGFMLAAPLSHAAHVGFVPARKKGKLPFATHRSEYALEYGTDSLEMHVDAIEPGTNVLVIDDLVATGGTMEAACKLVEMCGAKVAACLAVVDLPDIGGSTKLLTQNGRKLVTLVSFEGH
eukprot:ANDGO_01239.mRNA.1 Adenine phosphoribosyltransferase